MKNIHLHIAACISMFTLFMIPAMSQVKDSAMDEQYRPQVHFTPKEHWINDPNGMVYYKGVYHLFFQYHPFSSVWGPMHWGHATSTDMIHWKRRPTAIYPDSIGTIFSGSAVVDKNNTSGFGKNGEPPLVAIFTQHSHEGENAGRNDFQNQSIAYSNDNGNTWTKYKGNPVIKNPGLRDFRDPKVMWYEPQKKWVLVLAAKNKIEFYSSPDLKNWTKESEFGEGRGAHGGGWECPDLVSIDDNGKQRWVLIVNLNPGAPNKGSGTQYFIGDFDGKNFTSGQQEIQWLDYGPDNYAGVTWSNTGKRKILIGWMSNWLYANQVPTETYRNAMTLPRELKIKHLGNKTFVVSTPVKELSSVYAKTTTVQQLQLKGSLNISAKTGKLKFPCQFNLNVLQEAGFSLVFSNNEGEELVIGYDKEQKQYFIDRSQSGKTAFQNDFAAKLTAPRFLGGGNMKVSLVMDASSAELFADGGLTVMTALFFPNKPYSKVELRSSNAVVFKTLEYTTLKSIWK